MKRAAVVASIVVLAMTNAAGQAQVHTTDLLTGLPLNPATVIAPNAGNDPVKMPDGRVCKSTMQGNFYSLYNLFLEEERQSRRDERLVCLTSVRFQQGERVRFPPLANGVLQLGPDDPGDPDRESRRGGRRHIRASVAYERYQPGLSKRSPA